MKVWGEQHGLFWKGDNDLGEVSKNLSRPEIFSLCGRITGHLPVCDWLHVVASCLKRRRNAVTTSWDSELADPEQSSMLVETLRRVKCPEAAQGRCMWMVIRPSYRWMPALLQ